MGYSTYMALTLSIDKITSAVDRREHIIGVLLDFVKAFDKVNHDILVRTLDHYGIREPVLQWFLIIYLVENKEYSLV